MEELVVAENILTKEQIEEQLELAKQSIDNGSLAAILCKVKRENPNFLSIVHTNNIFCAIFKTDEKSALGRNYDFLFENSYVENNLNTQIEYSYLIRSIKNFMPCEVIVAIKFKDTEAPSKFRITFTPNKLLDGKTYATITFEKVEFNRNGNAPGTSVVEPNHTSNVTLKRALRNEKILREIGGLITSDQKIRNIVQNIGGILCDYLKLDRCIIYDYRNESVNFIIERTRSGFDSILENDRTKKDEHRKLLLQYIEFQMGLYRRLDSNNNKIIAMTYNDIASDHDFFQIRDICKGLGIGSQISVNTVFHGKINGGIYLCQSDPRNWLMSEIELVENIANQFSVALERSVSMRQNILSNYKLTKKTKELSIALSREQELRKLENEFVAVVSHEFKTPMQIIDSTREMLYRKLKAANVLDENVEKLLERIKSGVKRMNGLITSTLNLAKLEAQGKNIKVDKKIGDFRKFIYDIIDNNSHLAGQRNIKIITKINNLPTNFNYDPILLEYAISNTISNAVKYSRENSSIKIASQVNDKEILLKIIDRGIGIPKEDLKRVSQKFFRASNTLAVAGTGIGLHLTKEFLHLHNGTIEIKSKLHMGTMVLVTVGV